MHGTEDRSVAADMFHVIRSDREDVMSRFRVGAAARKVWLDLRQRGLESIKQPIKHDLLVVTESG